MAKGGRPKSPPDKVRTATIGVRVTPSEYAELRAKAERMGMTPGQWLRTAALTRRLPPPPVPEANRAEYVQLGRLAGNINQLLRLAYAGSVSVDSGLLESVAAEVRRLRLALLGIESEDE